MDEGRIGNPRVGTPSRNGTPFPQTETGEPEVSGRGDLFKMTEDPDTNSCSVSVPTKQILDYSVYQMFGPYGPSPP